jgi:hypothetical protein
VECQPVEASITLKDRERTKVMLKGTLPPSVFREKRETRRLLVVWESQVPAKPLDQFPFLLGLRVVLLATPIGPTMAAAAAECRFALRYIKATDPPATATGEPVSCPTKVRLGHAEVDYLADRRGSKVLARDCNASLARAVCHDHTGDRVEHWSGGIAAE